MAGEKELDKLLTSMSPSIIDGEYVFCTFPESHYGDHSELVPIASFAETEGLTLLVPKSKADAQGLHYESVFKGITLNVHSSLDAVGLTAAFSQKLTEHGISANVIAAYYHDHIFVQSGDAEKAIAALNEFSSKSDSGHLDGNTTINIRPADRSDLAQLCSIINEIIKIGGTTAFENVLTEDEFESLYLSCDNFICFHLAEDSNGLVLGFQSLTSHEKLPESWADIATFARVQPKVRGVGTTLFRHTLDFARSRFECINATIRADNDSGLNYYSKMGFDDYAVDRGVPLQDGTPVDRISKKFAVNDK